MSPRVVGLAIGIFLVGAGGVAAYLSTRNAALDQYNTAPRCASLSDAEEGKNCRITTEGSITIGPWNRTYADISAVFPDGYVSDPLRILDYQSLSAPAFEGVPVPIELWGTRVTMIAGVTTEQNPVNDQGSINLRMAGILLLTLGCASVLAPVVWRRLPVSFPGMGPVAVSDALWR